MSSGHDFDARDLLVSPPWITCPSCGKDRFGVGLISGSRLMRRCRDCWHKVGYELPKLQKKIIYLDQFVVSNLMKLKNPVIKGHATVAANPFWQELHDLLFQLRHLQMICCPDSGSHVEESRTSGFNADLKKMYEALSGGITFTSFDDIKSDQICELMLAWSEGREPVFKWNVKNVLSSDPNEWNERFYITMGDNPFISEPRLRQVRSDIHAYIKHLFQDVWAKEKRTFKYWYDLERFSYQGRLRSAVIKSREERLKAVSAFRPGVEPSIESLDIVLPSFAESLVEGMRHIIQFPRNGGMRSPQEILQLEESFGKANRIAEAPFVKLQSMMYAAMAMRAVNGQKESPNRGTTTDVDIVAHLLPYCDAMFLDNGCRSLLHNIPSQLRPRETSRVFSLNVKTEFLAYLRSIRDSISAEHVQAIREVYGDDYLKGLPLAGQS